MKEQEAQQAQTIAIIRERNNTGPYGSPICKECDVLLEIVDSQAQKIADLQTEVKTQIHSKEMAREAVRELEANITEQAKEIEKLRQWVGEQDLDAMIARDLIPW